MRKAQPIPRSFTKLCGATLLAVHLILALPARLKAEDHDVADATAAAAAPADHPPPRTTPEQAIKLLQEGNQRFVDGEMRHFHQTVDWRAHLASGQQPFVTLIGCSDSRVSPELIFDQGLGDIFVIRLAGNVISGEVVGSIEYAVRHLKTPLVVVLGHEGCGAVTAAVAAIREGKHQARYVEQLIRVIEPGLRGLDPTLQGEEALKVAVEMNARYSGEQLLQLPEAQEALQKKTVALVRAVYELKTGRVRFLAD